MTNVFIDTSVYEQWQFVASGALKSIIAAGEEKYIQILLPSITEREVLRHINKRVNEDRNKFIEKLSCSILKELPSLKDKIDELRKLAVSAAPNVEAIFLDNVKRSKTVRIPLQENIDLASIVDSYFKEEPPFSDHKKSEFPDAFVIQSLEIWCKENDTTCIVLANDGDFKNYKSDRLVYRDTQDFLTELTERIQQEKQREEELKEISRKARLSFIADANLQEQIKNWVNEQLYNEVLYCSALGIEDINDYTINQNMDIDVVEQGEVIGMYDGCYVHSMDLQVVVKIDVQHPDYDTAYYDGEDKQWYFFDDNKETALTSILEFPIEVLSDEDGHCIEINNINNNKHLPQSELINSMSSGWDEY